MKISEKIQNKIFQIIYEEFCTAKGIAISCFLVLIFFLTSHAIIKDSFDYEWVTFILTEIILFVYWLVYKYKYPKNNNRQTGIVIAIYAKDHKALELKEDFINELEKNFNSASLNNVFNLIVLKNHHAKLVKNKKNIDILNQKIQGRFYLYGDVQRELDGDSYKYFINLEGYVAHSPTPIPVAQELSMDFRKLLPKEIDFSDIFGYRCIRATSKIAYLAAKYIVGVASFLSENPFLAYRLHKDLEQEFVEYKNIKNEMGSTGASVSTLDSKHLKKLKEKLIQVISNETLQISKIYYINGKISDSLKYLDISEQKNSSNYGIWLLRAVIAFEIYGDSTAAMQHIKKAERYASGSNEWRYSKAFLLFWTDKFSAAYSDCQKIASNSYRNELATVEEVESFNLKILKNRTDKPQLYFWIGYLILKKRGDLVLALEYFEKFMKSGSARIPFLEEKTKTFISEIKKMIT